jgi:hypothetical protein
MTKVKYVNSCLCGGSTRWMIRGKLICLNCNEKIKRDFVKIEEKIEK